MSRVVVHLQNISTLSCQLAQRSTPIPIAIIDRHQSCHTMTTTPLQDSRHVTSCGTNDDDDDDSHLPSDHLHDSSKFFILFYIYSLLMTIFLDYVQLTFSTLAQTMESQGHKARRMRLDPRYFYFVPYFFLY